jgi:hypothetical protein
MEYSKMLDSIGTIETLAVVAIAIGSLCYGLVEAAAYGTNAVPLHVLGGIVGYVAVWLYVFVRAN